MTPSRSTAPIAVLTSRVGADEKRLFDELDRRAVAYDHVDARQAIYHAPEARGANARSLPARSPRWELALNREIGQVRALYAARSLQASGTAVVNSAEAVEICGDKWRTTLALSEAGLPTPRTALGLTPEAAIEAIEQIGYPAVIKPLVGSWGRLVAPVPDAVVARSLLDHVAALPAPRSHLVYVQELIDKPERDIRVIVVDGHVLGATYRRGTELRTNVALGATVEPCPLYPRLCSLAREAATAVGADIAGVDLIEDADGALFVLEVNHRVEFSGFQRAHGRGVAVAERIVDCLVERLAR